MSARILDDDPACLDAVHALLDGAGAAEGPLLERVQEVLAGQDDTLRRLAAAQGGRDNFGAKLDRIADLVFPLGLRGHGDDVEAVVRRVVGRLNGLRVERDAARDARNEARALLTAALPHLERFPCVVWDGDVLTRVRNWLGVSDG